MDTFYKHISEHLNCGYYELSNCVKTHLRASAIPKNFRGYPRMPCRCSELQVTTLIQVHWIVTFNEIIKLQAQNLMDYIKAWEAKPPQIFPK